jgi:putative membrane protein
MELINNPMLSSIFYALLGFLLMISGIASINVLFKFELVREVVEEHNIAVGIMVAGFVIAIALIIAAAIR